MSKIINRSILFKVHWFNPNLCAYVPLSGLRSLAWVNSWRFAAKKFDYHTNIITTPFSYRFNPFLGDRIKSNLF